jgi:subtilase family serine protease
MRSSLLAAAVGSVVAALLAAGPASPAASAGPAASASPGGSTDAASPARSATPLVLIRPDGIYPTFHVYPHPPSTAQCETQLHIACYTADQVETAYGMPALYRRGIDGAGQTIMVAEAFGAPALPHDLAVFDKAFHLPAPASLKAIAPVGKIPPYNPKNPNQVGWALETTLDVEYAHAMAPHANILIIETPNFGAEGAAGFPQMERAEEYAINRHLGGVITQSFGSTEETFPTAQALLRLRGAYIDAARQHVTVVTGAGDSGVTGFTKDFKFYLHPALAWPGDDPLITSVGGSELHLNAAGQRVSPDTVWNDTYNAAVQRAIFGVKPPNPTAGGGGKSIIFARPSYQAGVAKVVGPQRGVPDISMSAACDGAVDFYHDFAGALRGWGLFCGTSESGPLMSGVVALADQVAGHPLGLINPAIYTLYAEHAPGIVDITAGNNTVSFHQGGKLHTVPGFAAGPGYDLASGVGTIYAPDFVPELARLAGGPATTHH